MFDTAVEKTKSAAYIIKDKVEEIHLGDKIKDAGSKTADVLYKTGSKVYEKGSEIAVRTFFEIKLEI